MAHKAESFKLDEKKKVIVLYTNVEPNYAEKSLIEFYLKNGYAPKMEEKKRTKTVAEMRKDFGEDKEALAEFNRLYKIKANKDKEEKSGFHQATKFYVEFMKKKKAAEGKKK